MPATAPASPAAPPPSSLPAPASQSASPAPSAAPNLDSRSAAPNEDSMYADAFADLENIDKGKPQSQPKTETETGASNPSESDTDGLSEETQPSASDAEEQSKQAESDAKPKTPEQPQRPVKAKELREAYEGLKKRVSSEYEPQLKQLREKVAQLESTPREIPKEVQEKFASIEKRNAELEEHIRFVDYQKSSDYQDKYWKPYEKAWSDAVTELKGLTMEVENPQTGETQRREVTEADLMYFANLDPAQRRQEINRLFPDDKEEVKRHIGEVRRLYDASQSALAKAKQEAETHLKLQSEHQRAMETQTQEMWKRNTEALAKQHPDYFMPKEGDEEGNTLLERGRALADAVMNTRALTAADIDLLPKSIAETIKANRHFTPQQLSQMAVLVRNKAMNHDRLAYRLNAANKEIAALKESLKAFEKSSPDNVKPAVGDRNGKGVVGTLEDDLAELDVLDRKFRG